MAGEGDLPVGSEFVAVSAPLTGLAPETPYVFRVVATNTCDLGCGSGEDTYAFSTYPTPELLSPCPNEPFRTGFSALLPDCRAYELATPPSTNGHPPVSFGNSPGSVGAAFGGPAVRADGTGVGYMVTGGALPGLGGSGSAQGDGYVASRQPAAGWQSAGAGPSGAQATEPFPNAFSPDLSFAAWTMSGQGTLANPQGATYLRYPDGQFLPVGRGDLATDPQAQVQWITAGATHVVFTSGLGFSSAIRLEEESPPAGTKAVYDRTRDPATGAEQTHVVSLLPGGAIPTAGQDATYKGASADGRGVVFAIGTTLYERLENAETLEVATGATFAGISADGSRVFYEQGGDLFAFAEGTTTQITATGDAVPVNVSADGSHVYFLSGAVINPGEENEAEEEAQPGAENLYVSSAGTTAFIATVTEEDAQGEEEAGYQREGLGLWTRALQEGGAFAIDPSRTTPDGAVFLFVSAADLTDYEAQGRAEVYRYDATSGELACISCLPTGTPPTGDANLETVSFPGDSSEPSPVARTALIANVTPDGERAFFQSPDALVAADSNGLQDVYEWEAQGKGGCTRAAGCLGLVSSGRGGRRSYLYGMSESGEDVFFSTAERLLGADTESTPSIYDARVGGGFAEPEQEPCQGEGCKPQPAAPPAAPNLGTAATGPSGNAPHRHHRHHHKKKHRKHRHHKKGRAGR